MWSTTVALIPPAICLYKISCRAEVVTSLRRSVTPTSELTSAGCHLTRLASDLGHVRQKYICTVPLWAAYITYPHEWRISMGSIRKKPLQEKKISQLSASDVTRVVSLDTNNQAQVYEESGELWEICNLLLLLLVDFVNQIVFVCYLDSLF